MQLCSLGQILHASISDLFSNSCKSRFVILIILNMYKEEFSLCTLSASLFMQEQNPRPKLHGRCRLEASSQELFFVQDAYSVRLSWSRPCPAEYKNPQLKTTNDALCYDKKLKSTKQKCKLQSLHKGFR